MTGHANRVERYESEFGPWYADDRPEDLYIDITSADPEAEITVDDCRAYVAGLS